MLIKFFYQHPRLGLKTRHYSNQNPYLTGWLKLYFWCPCRLIHRWLMQFNGRWFVLSVRIGLTLLCCRISVCDFWMWDIWIIYHVRILSFALFYFSHLSPRYFSVDSFWSDFYMATNNKCGYVSGPIAGRPMKVCKALQFQQTLYLQTPPGHTGAA